MAISRRRAYAGSGPGWGQNVGRGAMAALAGGLVASGGLLWLSRPRAPLARISASASMGKRDSETSASQAVSQVVTVQQVAAHLPGDESAQRWQRLNFRGRTVDLRGGPVFVAGLVGGLAGGSAGGGLAGGARRPAALAAAVATGSAGLFGLIDDVAGSSQAKGLHGHIGELARGHVTTGTLKIFGIGAGALGAAVLLARPPGQAAPPSGQLTRPAGPGPAIRQAGLMAMRTGLIAGTANLFNLLDLRPGRALKAGLAVSAIMTAGGGRATVPAGALIGAGAACLPADLGEKTMLGDCGANALGAAIGSGLAARLGPRGLAVTLAGVAGLILASEKVSFSGVIERHDALRRFDQWGRQP